MRNNETGRRRPFLNGRPDLQKATNSRSANNLFVNSNSTSTTQMEVHSHYDPAPNGYEEWWNEFPMEPELIYLSQIPFDSLMTSPDSCAYQSDQLSQDELEPDDSYYISSRESPSTIPDSVPVTPEPEVLQCDARDLQIDRKEFQTAAVQYGESNVSTPNKSSYEVQTNPHDLVLVLTRQFNHATAAGTEFRLMPVSTATETFVSTLDEATKQEIKNRLAQRRPITKPQPLPDEVLHSELTQILQQHNILQKSLARTLGISQSALSSYFNKKPKINGWKSLERQLFRWKAEFLAKKYQI